MVFNASISRSGGYLQFKLMELKNYISQIYMKP